VIAIDTDANTPIVGPKVIIIRWRRMTKEDIILSLDRNVDLAIRRPREPYVVVQVESRISGAISGGGRIGEEVRRTQRWARYESSPILKVAVVDVDRPWWHLVGDIDKVTEVADDSPGVKRVASIRRSQNVVLGTWQCACHPHEVLNAAFSCGQIYRLL